jgi:hypothetical protein
LLASLKLGSLQRRTLQAAAESYAVNVDLAADFLSARLLEREHATGALLGVVSEPYIPEHARFVGRLSIPFVTPAGVVGMRFRCLKDHDCRELGCAKYDSLAGFPTRLYNVAALHSAGDKVGCTEGELDALVATHVVGLPSVGVPGIKNWKEHFGRAFSDYEEVLVFADHDSDEDKGIKHARRAVKEIGEGARLMLPPKGLDLTEWVQRDGVGVVRNACGL